MRKIPWWSLVAVVAAVIFMASPRLAVPVSAAGQQVDLCHLEGNGSYHLINVSANAVPAHLRHGDARVGDAVPGNPGTRFGANCEEVTVANCAAIHAIDPSAPDGDYMVLDGRAFRVYCYDMAGTPRDYLSLVNTSGANFSQYTAGGASYGRNVRTHYTKIRIDPTTLTVNTGDQTFARSSGLLYHSGHWWQPVTSMPYGVAMDCRAPHSATGVANIDLTGTPFMASDAFVTSGFIPGGSATKSSSGQVVNLTGGGYCGYTEPTSVGGPFNTHDVPLHLAFLP